MDSKATFKYIAQPMGYLARYCLTANNTCLELSLF